MKNFSFFVALIAISFWLTNNVRGQVAKAPPKSIKHYKISQWTTDDGLASNTLLKLYQDENGFLWISSYDGLTRFDGSEFTTYTKKNGLPSSQIQGMIGDSQGNLWIGTGAGLVRHSNIGNFESMVDDYDLFIQTLWVDENNHEVLIGTRGQGLYAFDYNTKHYEKIESPFDKDIIRAILEDSSKNLWVGSEKQGLSYYENGVWKTFTEKDGLTNQEINCLYLDQSDGLYAGTNDGLFYFTNNVFTAYPKFSSKIINSIAKDSLGNLWVLTTAGLYKQNAGDGSWEELNEKDGLSNNHIQDILFDTEGSIWLTTYRGGLLQLSDRKFTSYSIANGLESDEISAIEVLAEDAYMLGSINGKLMIIDHGKVENLKIKSPVTERIHDILLDKSKNIWVATHTGLLLIQPNGEEKFFTKDEGLPSNQLWVIMQDTRGNYWIGSRTSGLIKMEFKKYPDQPVFKEYKKAEINSAFIMSIVENKKGELLIGTNTGGLNILSQDGSVSHYGKKEGLLSNVVFSIHPDDDGSIWLATTEGLSLLRNNTFFNYTYSDGLPFESIMDIMDDGLGYFWMPTGIGVVRVSKQELVDYKDKKIDRIFWKVFNKNDGMKKPQCTGASHSLKDSKGILWFPTFGGVVSVDPSNISTNKIPPKVYIEKVVVDDKEIDLIKNVILPPGNHRVVFFYTALSLLNPNSAKYRYRIENFDPDWVDAGTVRQAVYTNLKHGSYSFQVLASNNDGVWNTQGPTLDFVVQPYYYQTRWFYTLLIALFVFIVFGYAKWKTFWINQKSALLETEVQKRTEELMEKTKEIEQKNESLTQQNTEITSMVNIVAHDLRAPLNKITGFIYLLNKSGELNQEQQEYLHYIQRVTQHGNHLIRDLLDVHSYEYEDSRPNYSEIDIHKFIEEWKQPMVQELQRKEQHLQTKMEVRDSSFSCDPIFLTRILDNLLTNASKFSEKGTQVSVTISQNNHLLNFSVKDQGPGISAEDQRKMFKRFQRLTAKPTAGETSNGLGLSIIKTLTEKLQGEIIVKSQLGNGTEFIVRLPLQTMNGNS